MRSLTLRTIAIATVAVLGAGFALAFFYAPEDADQGFIQKIFYLHVPLAICALLGFVVAAIHAIRHLRTGDPIHDARSYVSIHLSVIFGVGVLLTGAIWARGSWGVWWEWREPTLVSFLIVFLLYATYYPLRYAIEDRDRQARYASVFAITAGAFVPLNFLAVRLAEPLIHPRTFSSAGGLPGDMMLAFLVCLAGMALLWVTLVRFELAAKAASADLGRIRRALLGDGAPPAPAPSIAPVGVSATSAMSAEPGERRRGRRADAAAPARDRGRRGLRRRRLSRLPAAAPGLRRDHGGEAAADPARPRRARRARGGAPALGGGRRGDERHLRPRRQPPNRAPGAARAARPHRGARRRGAQRAHLGGDRERGRGALHLQPDRALPGGRRPGRGGGGGARGARPRGRASARPSCSGRSTRCAARRRPPTSIG